MNGLKVLNESAGRIFIKELYNGFNNPLKKVLNMKEENYDEQSAPVVN